MQSYFLPRRYAPHKAALLGSVSAGTPLDPAPFTAGQRLPIPLPFRRFGMYVLRVDGDSMTLADGTGLTHGCFVLVDGHNLLTDYGQTYAFCLRDGSHVVKRLRLYQGRPAMQSDNPQYPPQHVTSSVRNCGRVYAYSHDGRTWHATGYRGWDG